MFRRFYIQHLEYECERRKVEYGYKILILSFSNMRTIYYVYIGGWVKTGQGEKRSFFVAQKKSEKKCDH